MYELDSYLEAQEDFPTELLALETEKGIARHFKTEILNKKIWYTMEEAYGTKPLVLDLDDVKKIIQLNKRGTRPAIEKYLQTDTASENEMSVGSVNQDLMEKQSEPKRKSKRNKNFQKRPHNRRRNIKAKS